MPIRFLLLTYLILVTCFHPCKAQNFSLDSLSRLIGKSKGSKKGEYLLEQARLYLNINTDSTISISDRVNQLGIKHRDNSLKIRAYAAKGEAHQKNGDYTSAISSYLEGLKIAEKNNEFALSGTIYNGIGVCYYYMSDLNKAKTYMVHAADAKRKGNDFQYYAIIRANLAGILIAQKHMEEAIVSLKEAESNLVEYKQPKYLAVVYNSLGAAYQTMSSDSCLAYYTKSLDFAKRYKDELTEMNVNLNLGDFYYQNKEFTKALEYIKRAIEINESRPEDTFRALFYERMSNVYEAIGDFKQAHYFKKMENESRQRVFSIEKQKEFENLELKYQAEKKEAEIQRAKQLLAQKENQQNRILFIGSLLFVISIGIMYSVSNRRKQKVALEKEKLKLFENIVHEIRTPLTLIDGPLQEIKKEGYTSEHIHTIEGSTNQLLLLVNDLLDASKVGKQIQPVSRQYANISDVIDQNVDKFSQLAANKNIQIIVEKQDNEESRFLPVKELDRILSNLISNAIKYTYNGCKIWVKSLTTNENITIEVIDNGPGIPKKDQKRIFDRFFRSQHTDSQTGTGIGLSLVKEVVQSLNGTIELIPSKIGTIFKVEIPIEVEESTIVNEELPSSLPSLLLVEDNVELAKFCKSILRDSFTLVHAIDGLEALQIMEEQLPDIVLTDLKMPNLDGISLLQAIRDNELTNHLPVVLFTAKSTITDRLIGLQHGADAYLTKPFSNEELKLTLENLYTAAKRNRKLYQEELKENKPFDERVRSEHAFVNKAIALIIDQMDNYEYSVNELASDLAVSRSQLHRKLDTLTGFSTTQFIRMIRLEMAQDLLATNTYSISEISYKCGFSTASYFTKSFKEYFGESPSSYIKKIDK